MRDQDHDFFFVKTKDKPDFRKALVVSPVQKIEKKKKKKKIEKKEEEETQVIMLFTKALYFKFYSSTLLLP
jgi:hypothetical protein